MSPGLTAQTSFDYRIDGPNSILGSVGETVRAEHRCTLTHFGDPPSAEGWSLAVVADGASIVDITTAGTLGDEAPLGLRDGGYEDSQLTSGAGNEGAVSGVLLALLKDDVTLPPQTTGVIAKIVVETVISPSPQTVTLRFQDDLHGAGLPVKNWVTRQGISIPANLISKDVFVLNAGFEYRFEGPEALVGGVGSVASGEYRCTLEHLGDPPGAQAWSIGVSAENAVISDVTWDGTAASEEPDGFLADGFETTELTSGPGNEGAVSVVVLSLTEDVTLPAQSTQTVARIQVEATVGAAEKAARLFYRNGLKGSGQGVNTGVTRGGVEVAPILRDLELVVTSDPTETGGAFVRGDCDGDGKVGGSPTEAILLLIWAFRGGDEPPCLAACDFNADGKVSGSPTDAVNILTFAFRGGDPPEAPFPECGTSDLETDMMLGCETPPADCE